MVRAADAIAQVAHDLSDAIQLGVLSLRELADRKEVRKVRSAGRYYGKPFPSAALADRCLGNAQLLSAIVDFFVRHTIATCIESLRHADGTHLPNLLPQGPEPYKDFRALEEFRNNLVLNSYEVNRMDNKGKYLIRQLVEAYVSDPRQLPDSVLSEYLRVKAREFDRLKMEGFRGWIKKMNKDYKPCNRLDYANVPSIVKTITKPVDGSAFRRLKADLFEKVIPYMALDADFMRAVADHISWMTDEGAEEEVRRLYR